MITTRKFRLQPSTSQKSILHEIFAIYNIIKRKGYMSFYELKNSNLSKNQKRKIVQPLLMEICHNNPYVNSILIDCEAKLAQQQTWFDKRRAYLEKQATTIIKKIDQIKGIKKKDRRLKGLYSRLSSVQNKLVTLQVKPIVFGKVDNWYKIWNCEEISNIYNQYKG